MHRNHVTVGHHMHRNHVTVGHHMHWNHVTVGHHMHRTSAAKNMSRPIKAGGLTNQSINQSIPLYVYTVRRCCKLA